MSEQINNQPIIAEVPGFSQQSIDPIETPYEQPAPADVLGLEDGKFQVRRSDGMVEQGLIVSGFAPDKFDRIGNRISMVSLRKEQQAGNGIKQILEKDVPEVLLKSWQETHEDQEKQPLSRVEIIFAPVVAEKRKNKEIDLDHLFDPNYDPSKISVEDAAVRDPEGRQRVTEESMLSAVQSLNLAKLADDHISRIIAEHNPTNVRGVELVEKLRTDPELRIHLGKYLMSKFDEYRFAMGDRVQRDTQKKPNYKGYEHLGPMKSSEYVPLLALSMLDGTFIDAQEDYEQVKDDGTVTNGEHRQAARLVLTGSTGANIS